MAIIETLPIMIIFLLLTGYSFGMFGVIQSATLNSIAARAYAFEIFRNRANLNYFRSNGSDPEPRFYARIGSRLHTVVAELNDSLFRATERPITMGALGSVPSERNKDINYHNNILPGLFIIGSADQTRYTQGVSPVWIKTGYGICVTAKCEPQ